MKHLAVATKRISQIIELNPERRSGTLTWQSDCEIKQDSSIAGVAAERFAREIVPFLKSSHVALAAAERQAVGPHKRSPIVDLAFMFEVVQIRKLELIER